MTTRPLARRARQARSWQCLLEKDEMSRVLHIDGEVLKPRDFDFESLRALTEQLIEPSALLAGREIAAIRLATLLELAGAHASAQSVVAETEDGAYVTTMSMESARECVVLYRVGDAALPRGLGGPFRLVTQGRLRVGDVKALGSIYVSERRFVENDDTERVCVRVTRAA
jgi:DMSO/TMAO reductase YedYZ molybdopterin-dependent catalytic subunit